jgi:hypothetical protein
VKLATRATEKRGCFFPAPGFAATLARGNECFAILKKVKPEGNATEWIGKPGLDLRLRSDTRTEMHFKELKLHAQW